MNDLRVIKTLNNSIVHCYSEELEREVLALGKGIGFNVKKDEYLIKPIEKVYEIKEIKNFRDYKSLVSSVDEDLVDVSEEVISMLTKNFGSKYNERLHVSLLDHLNFAIRRNKSHLIVGNIFNDETKFMYPKEYEFSKEMVGLINKKLNIDLPESEVGFITMHVHSALNGENIGITTIVVKIINDCLKIIEEEAHISLDDNDLSKQRLITHLKFAVKRALDKCLLTNLIDDVVREKYKEAYEISCKLREHIKETYCLELGGGEISYLALHIQNVINMRRGDRQSL